MDASVDAAEFERRGYRLALILDAVKRCAQDIGKVIADEKGVVFAVGFE